MFGVFLKATQSIESKVHDLQTQYIELLRNPILPVTENDNNNLDAGKKIIQEKIVKLADIKKQYTQALEQFATIKALLAEVKETSEEIESEIDKLFEGIHLEIPEDLVKSATGNSSIATEANASEPAEQSGQDSKDTLLTEQEEEDFSDKENSENCAPKSDSDESFSPNIQIRKSHKDTTVDCYTPAIKSTSKSKISLFKR